MLKRILLLLCILAATAPSTALAGGGGGYSGPSCSGSSSSRHEPDCGGKRQPAYTDEEDGVFADGASSAGEPMCGKPRHSNATLFLTIIATCVVTLLLKRKRHNPTPTPTA